MADKYKTLTNGRDTMVSATVTSAGVANAGQIVGLDSTGKLDVTLLPVGVGPDVASLVTSENLSPGYYVNIYSNSGTPTARRADASNDRPAHGFVKASTTSGATAIIYFEGPNTDLSGLTPGARYYLSTGGAATATVPVSPGSLILQFLGIAVSTASINTDIDDATVL